MASSKPRPTFPTFKEAFCYRYRCKPENFEWRVLFKTIYIFRWPAALFFWLINKRLFVNDVETITSLGNTGHQSDFNAALTDLASKNRIERSIRRRVFRIRVSGSRLRSLRERLDPWIAPPAKTNQIIGHTVRQTHLSPEGAGNLSVRKVRQIHERVTRGHALNQALAEAGYKPGDWPELLAVNAKADAGIAWLRDQYLRDERLAQTEAELNQLMRTVAAQAAELQELRERLKSVGAPEASFRA